MKFKKLPIGATFEFAEKTDIRCGFYNGIGQKITPRTYSMGRFVAEPSPDVEVVPAGTDDTEAVVNVIIRAIFGEEGV